jgi:hypothetical protein
VRITTTSQTVAFPAGATTGTVSVPHQLLILLRINETFTIASGLRLLEQSMIMTMAYCGNDRLRLRDLVIQLYGKHPSAIDVDYTFVLANGTAVDLDYTHNC